MSKFSIPFVKPFTPPLEDYFKFIEKSFLTGYLTSGPCGAPHVNALEEKFARYFNVKDCVLVCNATVGIELVLRALMVKKVLTTPFTYVATTSAILNANALPIYGDVDEKTLNLQTNEVENLILENEIDCILPVHVFGQPCNVYEIKRISEKHNIKVVYDSAHAFGSRLRDGQIHSFGDASVISLQATKLFNTSEGGIILTDNQKLAERLRSMRIFGLSKEADVICDGTNVKMNELTAGLGLANIQYINEILNRRKIQYKFYEARLKEIQGISFQKISYEETNFSYFPVILESEKKCLSLLQTLEKSGIQGRRYFHPSLDEIYGKNLSIVCPTSKDISRRIICLPMYHSLNDVDIKKVCEVIEAWVESQP